MKLIFKGLISLIVVCYASTALCQTDENDVHPLEFFADNPAASISNQLTPENPFLNLFRRIKTISPAAIDRLKKSNLTLYKAFVAIRKLEHPATSGGSDSMQTYLDILSSLESQLSGSQRKLALGIPPDFENPDFIPRLEKAAEEANETTAEELEEAAEKEAKEIRDKYNEFSDGSMNKWAEGPDPDESCKCDCSSGSSEQSSESSSSQSSSSSSSAGTGQGNETDGDSDSTSSSSGDDVGYDVVYTIVLLAAAGNGVPQLLNKLTEETENNEDDKCCKKYLYVYKIDTSDESDDNAKKVSDFIKETLESIEKDDDSNCLKSIKFSLIGFSATAVTAADAVGNMNDECEIDIERTCCCSDLGDKIKVHYSLYEIDPPRDAVTWLPPGLEWLAEQCPALIGALGIYSYWCSVASEDYGDNPAPECLCEHKRYQAADEEEPDVNEEGTNWNPELIPMGNDVPHDRMIEEILQKKGDEIKPTCGCDD